MKDELEVDMEEFLENLWICPLCSAEHPSPVIVCRRCECQLLLLNKIKLTGLRLREEGHPQLARFFYQDRYNETNK